MGCPGKRRLYPFQIFEMQQNIKSKSVMLSKRANVFYLEHVRVMQKNERVVYLTEAVNGIQQFVSIPDKNTTFILLGKGTSITDSAVRKLAESNVVIGFCGSGGSPLFANIDIAFLTPQDEYRPTGYGQKWFEIWSNEKLRILAFKMSIKNAKDTEFRAKIIDSTQNLELLDNVMAFLKTSI